MAFLCYIGAQVYCIEKEQCSDEMKDYFFSPVDNSYRQRAKKIKNAPESFVVSVKRYQLEESAPNDLPGYQGPVHRAALAAALGASFHTHILLDKRSDPYLLWQCYKNAVINGNANTVEDLLELPKLRECLTKPAFAASFTETWELAAAQGHLGMLKYLSSIENAGLKSTDNIPGSRGYAAFKAAVRRGDLEMVKYLLNFKRVRDEIDSDLPLRLALQKGHTELFKFLLTEPTLQAYQEPEPLLVGLKNLNHGEAKTELMRSLLEKEAFFSFADTHFEEYREFLEPFADEKLALLRVRKASLVEAKAEQAFDLSAEEAEFFYLLMRNLIRRELYEANDFFIHRFDRAARINRNRNAQGLIEDLRFLLSIPALKNLAAANNNELLRLAIQLDNRNARALLLTFPAVKQEAQRQQNYRRGQQGRVLGAQDRESSAYALTSEEQKRIEAATKHYAPVLAEKGGVESAFKELCQALASQYQKKPAELKLAAKTISLPLSWVEFERLGLNQEDRERALKAYYQHPFHSAYRYLSKPNPWMSPKASYVCVNPLKPSERWADFENYKPLLVLLYLAASDKKMPATMGHTAETRFEQYAASLALINRAHNWDKVRRNKNRPRALEEFDDLEGDKPSCYAGEKRRLFQSVQGHPLLEVLTKESINAELREFAVQCVQERIAKLNKGSLAKAFEDYVVNSNLSNEFKAVITIEVRQWDDFIKKLFNKYGEQWKPFEPHIIAMAKDAAFKDSNGLDAILLGRGVKWEGIFGLAREEVEDKDQAPEEAEPPSRRNEQKSVAFELLLDDLSREVDKLQGFGNRYYGFKLVDELREEQEVLCSNVAKPADKVLAIKNCYRLVEKAQDDFKRCHRRSLLNVLANIGLFLAGLAVVYLACATWHYHKTGRFTFFNKPALSTQLPSFSTKLAELQLVPAADQPKGLEPFRQRTKYSF